MKNLFKLGLTCNEQSFITKSGFQRLASKYGFIVANPDTSPRRRSILFLRFCKYYEIFSGGCGIEGEKDQWDFGEGAGYYIDATESKWADNYQMFSYINDEFYELIIQNFNVDINRIGIFG